MEQIDLDKGLNLEMLLPSLFYFSLHQIEKICAFDFEFDSEFDFGSKVLKTQKQIDILYQILREVKVEDTIDLEDPLEVLNEMVGD